MKDERLKSKLRLTHIAEAILIIEKHTHKEDLESFIKKDIVQHAVLFQFTIIGEAIKHVENSILNNYNYPWFKVRAFRNLISHEYFNIKIEAVWPIIIDELPTLKVMVNEIIQKEF